MSHCKMNVWNRSLITCSSTINRNFYSGGRYPGIIFLVHSYTIHTYQHTYIQSTYIHVHVQDRLLDNQKVYCLNSYLPVLESINLFAACSENYLCDVILRSLLAVHRKLKNAVTSVVDWNEGNNLSGMLAFRGQYSNASHPPPPSQNTHSQNSYCPAKFPNKAGCAPTSQSICYK